VDKRATGASAAAPVVDPGRAAFAGHQARLAQHLQVVADRGLGQREGTGQVAHTRLAALVRGDQRQQPQPHGIPQGLERRGQLAAVSGSWVRTEEHNAGSCIDTSLC
jgi:hypothetical protein